MFCTVIIQPGHQPLWAIFNTWSGARDDLHNAVVENVGWQQGSEALKRISEATPEHGLTVTIGPMMFAIQRETEDAANP